MGALSIPKTQLLALSYAALEPSSELLGKYLNEIDKLEKQGAIAERDLQLLRSSPLVYDELMHLTLGDDTSLSAETVMETLERVSKAIKKEEFEKLTEEQEAHQRTRNTLEYHKERNQKIVNSIFWQCRRNASVLAWTSSGLIVIMLMVGLLAGLELRSTAPIIGWGLTGGSILVALVTLANLVDGFNVKRLHRWVQNRCLTWLLRRKAKATGVDLSAFDMD